MSGLKELRVSKGLRQEDLSDISTVKLSTIQKLEGKRNNISNASIDTVMKLSVALGLTVEEFMNKVKED